MREPDHVRQGREIAQLEIGIARDVVSLADGGKQLRLLDGIDTQIGFEVEIQVEHVSRIAGLFHHQFQDAIRDRVAGGLLRGWRYGRGLRRGAGASALRSGRR